MRDWIALHIGVLDSDTWADLEDHRLAWVVTLLLAAQQTPEGEFDSPAKLVRLLTKEDIPRPLEALDQMTRAGCLEKVDGALQVHGWERWQRRLRGSPEDRERDAARKREAYWRAKYEALQGHADEEPPETSEPSPDVSIASGQKRREEKRREEKRGGPPAGAGAREGEDDLDALDTFYELTLNRPWGKPSGRWIRELMEGYGLEAVNEALRAEAAAKPGETNSLLSRAEARLGKAADRKRQEVRRDPKPRPVPAGRTQEERAALQEMLEVNG